MKYRKYFGEWNDKEDMLQEFEIEESELDGVDIVLASYDRSGYEGNAFVLYWDTKTECYYEVNASHCSCYGLEGQWEPETTFLEAIRDRVENGKISYYIDDADALRTLKEYLEE